RDLHKLGSSYLSDNLWHTSTFTYLLQTYELCIRKIISCYFLFSFNLPLCEKVAKSKSKTILVKMLSQAGTGYSFNTKRSRLREKLTLLHYDPIVKTKVLFVEQKKIRSL
uniref:Large ribosomal subunit protein bL33m n=1 Tax=Ursus americanus TaxID=9643 RepID=A0A452QZI1_URSAM